MACEGHYFSRGEQDTLSLHKVFACKTVEVSVQVEDR